MMSDTTFKVTILMFDKTSDRLARVVDVPNAVVAAAMDAVSLPADARSLEGEYHLAPDDVRRLADVAHLTLDPTAYDYFLAGMAQ